MIFLDTNVAIGVINDQLARRPAEARLVHARIGVRRSYWHLARKRGHLISRVGFGGAT